MKKIQLVIAEAIALDPKKKYVIGIDKDMITSAEAASLANHLSDMGIKNVVIMVLKGDPKKGMRIIEQ